MGALVDALREHDVAAPLAERLCRASAEVSGADGAAITVEYARAERMTLASSSDLARRMEDIQEVVGEGPGWDATATDAMVGARLDPEGRWPMFTASAVLVTPGLDIAASPIRAGGEQLGVLTITSRVPGPSPAGGEETPPPPPSGFFVAGTQRPAPLPVLADLVGMLMANAADAELEEHLPWADRVSIHHAVGRLMARHRVAASDARALLNARAFADGLSLSATAARELQQLRVTPQTHSDGGTR